MACNSTRSRVGSRIVIDGYAFAPATDASARLLAHVAVIAVAIIAVVVAGGTRVQEGKSQESTLDRRQTRSVSDQEAR
jgi:hypothetical protein